MLSGAAAGAPGRERGLDVPATPAETQSGIEAAEVSARYDRFRAPPEIRDGERLDREHVTAHLRMETHRIEKGLSIRNARRPFGLTAADRIRTLLEVLDRRGWARTGSSAAAKEQAIEALLALHRWNDCGERSGVVGSGTTPGSQANVLLGRSTVRSFDSGRAVPEEVIRRAALIAANSPSVCNRASGRIHVYRDAAQIGALLALQRGNRGLTGVTNLAVVSVELGLFVGADEHTQPGIDGGIFLMNLVWGFETQGIGSCLLNWSMPETESDLLRQVGMIPASERIIALLAFGFPAPGYLSTRSAKPPRDTILTMHEARVQSG